METTRTREPNSDHMEMVLTLTWHQQFSIQHSLSTVQACTVYSKALSSHALSSSTKWMFLCSQEWT